jgi:hypothetical protein
MAAYTGPINYITMVEALKRGPHTTILLQICMNSSMKQPLPSKKSLNRKRQEKKEMVAPLQEGRATSSA